MPDTIPTVRDVFELPPPGTEEESSPRWQSLREWMTEELKSVNANATADIATKVAELLEIPIPNIFLNAWKRSPAIRKLLEESTKSPEAGMTVELSEHAINSLHHPHIEVRVKKEAVKRIEFTLRLLFNLKGFVLTVRNGAIREMKTGPCEMKGTFEYQRLPVAERKLSPISLPATVLLEPPNNALAAQENGNKTPENEEVVEREEVVL